MQKPNIWSKKNAGVLERAQNDVEQKTEETDAMDKARQVILLYYSLGYVFVPGIFSVYSIIHAADLDVVCA